MLKLPPLSLYIHIPWCIRKCPYCDFNSHAVGAEASLPEQRYLDSLEEDLTQSIASAQDRKLTSVFFGGGTPSLVSEKTIYQCIEMADRLIGLDADAEITLEANPATFEQEKFLGFREAGVNRLSIGAQSFNDEHLKSLGRLHDAEEAKTALQIARNTGFENVNIDLMYGLPKQTTQDAMADLQQAISLKPDHISWYELTIEPNTEFFRHPPKTPSDSIMDDMSATGIEILQNAGYEQYEVSAYARDGKYCSHNLNYWRFGDYLGIGAGAHEKITVLDDQEENQKIVRRNKTRQPEHYTNRIGSYAAQESNIETQDLAFEFCMNALRLKDGVDSDCFESYTGMELSELNTRLGRQIAIGAVEPILDRIKTTNYGFKYLNTVLQDLMT